MNRLCLIDRRICPPEPFFRYMFPEDGYALSATTYDSWLEMAKAHARANGLSDPDPADMEEQLCRTLPPGWCNYDDPNRPRVLASLGWEDVLSGLSVFKAWLGSGMKLVDQGEAERRALICSRCYFNVHVTGCAACQALVNEATRNLSTRTDWALHGCAVCKCVLRAKVHFPLETLDRENPRVQEMYPDHCWLKKQGDNYRG